MSSYCPVCRTLCAPQAPFCPQCGYRLPLTPQAATGSTIHVSPGVGNARITTWTVQPIQSGMLLAGRFQIGQKLGEGSFGTTYLATDTQLNQRPCVVKQLKIDPTWNDHERTVAKASFKHEAAMLIHLNEPGHPNIPEIYSYLEHDACLVMKYIAGQSLEAVTAQRPDGRLEVTEALRSMRDIGSALVYMHTHPQGVVLHRDIKPTNIMLGNDGRVWLIDFGLAKANPVQPSRGHKAGTTFAGTIGYTPPEQWQGRAEPRSDVYALAATLHTLLTGYAPPWTEADIPDMVQGKVGAFPAARTLNPSVPASVERLIAQCMAVAVADRPDAAQVVQEMDGVLNPRIIQAPNGALLANERDLARWGEQHWTQLAEWLYERDTLPNLIEQIWQKSALAQDIRTLKLKYSTQRNAGVDALLALLDPTDFGAQAPAFTFDATTLDFGILTVGDMVNKELTLRNISRRTVRIRFDKTPSWIYMRQNELTLRPLASETIVLNAVVNSATTGGKRQTALVVRNGSQAQTINIQANLRVALWEQIVLKHPETLKFVLTLNLMICAGVAGLFFLPSPGEVTLTIVTVVICIVIGAPGGSIIGETLNRIRYGANVEFDNSKMYLIFLFVCATLVLCVLFSGITLENVLHALSFFMAIAILPAYAIAAALVRLLYTRVTKR